VRKVVVGLLGAAMVSSAGIMLPAAAMAAPPVDPAPATASKKAPLDELPNPFEDKRRELREAAGFIHDVVVADTHRGRGIGEALVQRASDWLRERGAPRVLLWTAQRNVAAQRLFLRLGFRATMIEMTREL